MKRLMLASLSVVVAAAISGTHVQAQDQQQADRPSTPTSPALMEFQSQYSQLNLKLAQLELQRALDVNRRIPNTFSQAAIAALRQSADLAKLHVEQIQKHTKDPLYGLYIGSEEASMKIAENEYRSALGTNERLQNTYSPDDLERLKLTYEVAKTRWEYARELESQPPLTRIEWQLELMREEMVRLRARVEQLRRLN